ncbi:MAG: hypothetical protein SWY16_20150 [Cyanobacteriota bacterium]|nr:hypothetical protein [Cyanobacteriota bacterium]
MADYLGRRVANALSHDNNFPQMFPGCSWGTIAGIIDPMMECISAFDRISATAFEWKFDRISVALKM